MSRDSKTILDNLDSNFLKSKLQLLKGLSLDDYLKMWFEIVEVEYSCHTSQLDKEQKNFSTLIELPEPYIVAGGRFQEMYYWDSFFICLGLKQLKMWQKIRNVVDNMVFMISEFGHILNGNRTYYLNRSQPPFFSHILRLLFSAPDGFISHQLRINYLEALKEEMKWWIKNRSVEILINGKLMNFFHYDDDGFGPRCESEAEDLKISLDLNEESREQLFRDLRAGAESGWDFSSRWIANYSSINDKSTQSILKSKQSPLSDIHTTQILPVDLNCLIYDGMKLLFDEGMPIWDQEELANFENGIDRMFWNEKIEAFTDFNFATNQQTMSLSLATCFPLFSKLASKRQAELVSNNLRNNFLKRGGLVTSTVHSKQQWDAPNGWAPLQWIAVQGLLNYSDFDLNDKETSLANEIRSRFCAIVEETYQKTEKVLEKYNVEDIDNLPQDGEYFVQEGFGWTNGVYLDLKKFKL